MQSVYEEVPMKVAFLVIVLFALCLVEPVHAADVYDGTWSARGTAERGCEAPTFTFTVKDSLVTSGFYQGGKGSTNTLRGSVSKNGTVVIDLGNMTGVFQARLQLMENGKLSGSVKTPNCGTPVFTGSRM